MLSSLDEAPGMDDLARRSYHSRSSFFRLFQALVDETPAAMRRRLLLERAAWQLGSTARPITDIAFEANYGSLEAFTRAFRKAFRISPSLYRRTGCARIHLPAENDFHFLPGTRPLKGPVNMDLFDIFAGTDSWYTRRLLQQAATVADEKLDYPVSDSGSAIGWDKPDRSLRDILERIVQTKEVWVAALTGGEMPALDGAPAADRTPAALLDRFEKVDADFHRILGDIRDRGAWNDTFVDALCEPPETFTFGGMFADVITFNTWRRLAALDAFHKLGIKVQGSGSPIEYQQSQMPD